MTEDLQGTADLLGLKKKVSTTLDFVPFIRRGLSAKAVAAVAKALALSPTATVLGLGLAARSYVRWTKNREPLSPDASARLLRLARVVAIARDVLGDPDLARRWIKDPSRALGGVAPLELLDTDIGAEAVFHELGRMDHGVYS